MSGNQVSKIYAKSLIDLSEKEATIVEDFAAFMHLINSSTELENVLFMEMFNQAEKMAVLEDITAKLNPAQTVKNFLFYLVGERRIGLLPSIYKDLIVMDDDRRGFLKGTIEGADDAIDAASVEKFKKYISEKSGKNAELTYVKSSKVTAGYRITAGDFQLDATLDNQLDSFKKSLLAE